MQLLCKASETGSDLRCPVCGQGFLLYWTRKSPQDQPVLVSVVMDALGRQHVTALGADAHAQPLLDTFSGVLPSASVLPDRQWGYC